MSDITSTDNFISFPLEINNKGHINEKFLISDLAAYRSTLTNIEQSMLMLRQQFGSQNFGHKATFKIALHLWKNGKCEPQYQLRWLLVHRLPPQTRNVRLYIMTPLHSSYCNQQMPHHDVVSAFYSSLRASPLFDELMYFERQRLMLNAQVRTVRFAINEIERFLSYLDLGELI